jgi:F420-0:gamma-glutamyl ligase
VPKAILTLKDNILVANSGVDQSNVPKEFVILWPKNFYSWADRIRKYIKQKFKVNVGVIVRDSNCHPLRRGTFGVALAIAGFEGVRDVRDKIDLFGKKLIITRENVADNLASAATLVMGETTEKVPVVVIKNALVRPSNKSSRYLSKQLIVPRRECLFRDY